MALRRDDFCRAVMRGSVAVERLVLEAEKTQMIWNWLISHVAVGLAAALCACVMVRYQIAKPL
jgi:hypothetical protein